MKGTTQKNYISVGDIVEVNDVKFKAEPEDHKRIKRPNDDKEAQA